MSNSLSQAEYLEQMRSYLIANQDNISDFNEGSTLDTQMNAFATQLNQVQNKATGLFKSQFEKLPFQAFNFKRKEETTATGAVVFSRQNADLVQVEIPVGTVVSTEEGLLYTTQEAGVVLSGSLNSTQINIIAESAGADYNAFQDKVNIIVSSMEELNSVTNNIAISGGTDEELNSQYYARFANFILGLSGSNRYGVFTASASVEDIQSAYVLDHFPPKEGLYNFTVYVDDGSGSVAQSKLDEVKLVLYGNRTEEYQGYVGAGINFDVLSAGLVSIDITYEIAIDATVTSKDVITTLCNNQLTNYINNLWVGSDVIWSEANRLLKRLNGVSDVVSLTLNGVEENVITTPSQVPRVNSIAPEVTS